MKYWVMTTPNIDENRLNKSCSSIVLIIIDSAIRKLRLQGHLGMIYYFQELIKTFRVYHSCVSDGALKEQNLYLVKTICGVFWSCGLTSRTYHRCFHPFQRYWQELLTNFCSLFCLLDRFNGFIALCVIQFPFMPRFKDLPCSNWNLY